MKLYSYKKIFIIHGLFLSVITFSQVGIGTHSPNSIFEIKSNSHGVLFPRVTTIERNAMTQSEEVHSQLVYDTDKQELYHYDKTDGWKPLDSNERLDVGTKNNPVFILKREDLKTTTISDDIDYIDYNYVKWFDKSHVMITCSTNYILEKTTSSNTGLLITLLYNDTVTNRVDSGNTGEIKSSQNNSESVTSIEENLTSPQGTLLNFKLRYTPVGNSGFSLTIDNALCKLIEIEN
ncbi:MAG: hypothetical protein ACK5MD_11000 [Flavobacteriales bacterium]